MSKEPLRNIYRSGNGWVVKVGSQKPKWFGDKRYGDKAMALIVAKHFRDAIEPLRHQSSPANFGGSTIMHNVFFRG